jgi:hypothetical protein
VPIRSLFKSAAYFVVPHRRKVRRVDAARRTGDNEPRLIAIFMIANSLRHGRSLRRPSRLRAFLREHSRQLTTFGTGFAEAPRSVAPWRSQRSGPAWLAGKVITEIRSVSRWHHSLTQACQEPRRFSFRPQIVANDHRLTKLIGWNLGLEIRAMNEP